MDLCPGKKHPHRSPERADLSRDTPYILPQMSVSSDPKIVCNKSLFEQIKGITCIFFRQEKRAGNMSGLPSDSPHREGQRGGELGDIKG
jgi:hypothetical protein